MNLLDELYSYAPETVIKVGATDGSAFFYVGTAEDFRENADYYSFLLHEEWKKTDKRCSEAVKTAVKNYPTLAVYVADQLKNAKPDLTVDGYIKCVNAWLKKIGRMHAAELKMHEKLDSFEELKYRNIVYTKDSDPAADVEGSKIVVINGYEFGSYWTTDEAKKTPSLRMRAVELE